MKKGKYIWMNGKFVKWNDAKVHVLTHALHYGGSVYEGIRVYPVREGRKVVPTIFRLDDHLKRFVNSMADIEMKPVPVARLRKVIMELVKKNGIKDGYIRPIAFYGYERLGIYWEGLPVQISIAAMPWGVYLPKEMKLKTSKWRRLSPDSVKIEAKVGG